MTGNHAWKKVALRDCGAWYECGKSKGADAMIANLLKVSRVKCSLLAPVTEYKFLR
jgi:hypothetical protein